jgi:histidyl-tRNA synthetase
MRILDCKNETCQGIVASAPLMLEHVCQECQEHFSELQEFLTILEVPFSVNPRIVRGLDYYVRTAFEFISFSLGAQNALLGGGRYDGLSEDIGGPPLPGVGFAMGIERLLSLAQLHTKTHSPEVFIAVLGASARKPGLTLQKSLRYAGIRTEIEYQGRSLKSQMKKAGKIGVSYVIIIGEDELQKGIVVLRNMAESSQDEIVITDVVNTLVKVLRNKNA